MRTGICCLLTAFIFLFDQMPLHANDSRSFIADKRIVGGHVADQKDWIWMANIVSAEEKSLYDGHICAGALISPNWVATTAHCVQNIRDQFMKPEEIDVVFGAHDLIRDTGIRIGVKRIITHPLYDWNNNWNCDIALLELKESAPYSPIYPIGPELQVVGMQAVIVGWGNTSVIDFIYPEKLMEATVPIVSNEVCNTSYNKDGYYTNPITNCMMCAGYANGGTDACQNDSGGPLMVKIGDYWRLAGLISWGEGCAQPGYYGVYTKISEFIDFIYSYVPIEAPQATDDAYTVFSGGAVSEPAPGVLKNDAGSQGKSLTASLVSNVTHGNLTLNPDGSFTYTNNSISPEIDRFSYIAGDGIHYSKAATVTITVTVKPQSITSPADAEIYAGSGCFISASSF